MKKTFAISLIFMFLVSACSSSSSTTPSKSTPTANSIQVSLTTTATKIPPISTFTPTPTLVLPVAYQTSIPISNTQIKSENIKNLREVARFYGEIPFTTALSSNHKFLFVRDLVGVDIYNYMTKKHLYHIDLFSRLHSSGDLQISTNGEWALVDQTWLLHIISGKEPNIRNLRAEINLTFSQASLSPDGSKIAITEGYCSGNCLGVFQIISLSDNQVLYSWDNGTYKSMHGYNSIFSSDGSSIITRVDNSIILWRISDGTEVARIKNIQGLSHVVLSSDSSLIAIGQIDTVQIWNVTSGQQIQTIRNLCGELYNPPQPVFLNAERIVVLECPRDEKGKVSAWKVADATAVYESIFGNNTVSRILFEEDNDRIILLENLRKVGPWIIPRIPYTIQFLNNNSLAFVQLDDQLRNAACIISPDSRARCSENVILGTDEQLYAYTWRDDGIEFYRGDTISGNPTYFVHWKGYFVNALDPINDFLFYTAPSSGGNAGASNSVVIGLDNDESKIGEWKGSELESVVFSANHNFAAVCRRSGGVLNFQSVDRDKLVLIDMVQKKVVTEEPFTCLGTPMVLSQNGSRLISAYSYTDVVGGNSQKKHKLMAINTTQPLKKDVIDIGCDWLNALTFSPNESVLALACNDGTLRFLNSETFSEIYRQTNIDPDLWGLAFSKDGTKLAMASRRGYISVWAVPPFSFNP